MVILSKLNISETVIEWLGYIPVAVLAAILAPSILLDAQQHIALHLNNLMLLAAIPCFLVAVKTRSLVFTLIVGMIAMALLQNFWAS